MKKKTQNAALDAVSVVREIRDHQAALLQGMSPAAVRAFFQREAAAANAEARQLARSREACRELTVIAPVVSPGDAPRVDDRAG